MRVLHVFKDAYPPTFGGVEQHVWDVSRALSSEFEFEVLTSSRSRTRVDEEREGVRFVRVPEYGRFLSTPVTPGWERELRQADEDGTIFHLHLPLPVAEAAMVLGRLRAPVVASFYADVVRNPMAARAYRVLQQRFLDRADRIVVSSQRLLDSSPALARHRARVAVVPFGFDPAEWPTDPVELAAVRHEADGGPIVLFLGRLVPYKGVHVLIEALRDVDATLLIVGDGPLRPQLEAAAGPRVRFVGNVSNQRRSAYYAAADVFALPAVSRAETFGIAMLEAMSFGVPAVSTEVGTATSWVNVDGQTGRVVRPGDPPALAQAIRALLADDHLRREYGAAAARRAAEQFPKAAMVEGLAAVYRQVSEAGPLIRGGPSRRRGLTPPPSPRSSRRSGRRPGPEASRSRGSATAPGC